MARAFVIAVLSFVAWLLTLLLSLTWPVVALPALKGLAIMLAVAAIVLWVRR